MGSAAPTLFVVFAGMLVVSPLLVFVGWLVRGRRGAERERTRAPAASSGEVGSAGTPARWRGFAAALLALALVLGAMAWYVRGSGGSGSAAAPAGMGSTPMEGMVPLAPTQGMPAPSSSQTPSAPPMPGTLAGLRQVALTTGPAAVAEVDRMHAEGFPLTGAAVARFEGDGGKAEVWVADTADPAGAAQMARAMATRIAGGGSPFSAPQPVAGEEQVWRTRGMGRLHYFLASGRSVWWLSVDRALAARALRDLLAAARP